MHVLPLRPWPCWPWSWRAPTTHAANTDGTWTNTAGGTWSDADTGNWAGGIVADGSGYTADFNSIDIVDTVTVSLGASRTIGNLIFGNTDTGTAGSWVVDNNSTPANTLTLAGTPTITVNALGSGGLATISAIIDGTDGLTKDGTDLLVLTGANTYSGGTTISTGSLQAKNSAALGTGDVTVASGARLQLYDASLSNTINLNGSNAILRSHGSPALSGTVNLQSNSTITTVTNNNGTTTLSGTLNLAGFTLNVKTQNLKPSVAITGVIAGSGGISKDNDGTLLISNDNSAGYTGTTTLNRGDIAIADNNALGTGTLYLHVNNDTSGTIRSNDTTAYTIANPVTVGGGNGNSRILFGNSSASYNGDLTFTGPVTLNATRQWRVYNTTTVDGVISGNYGITKNTAGGTLVLIGENLYTGDTTVSAGTLLVNNTAGSGTGSGNVTVGTGGTLGGSGAISGTVTADGILAPGNSIGTLTVGSTTLSDTAIFSVELGAGESDLLIVNGDLGITAGAALDLTGTADGVTNYVIATYSGTLTGDFGAPVLPDGYSIDYGTGSDSQISLIVPEPASLSLLACGAGLLAARRRRRK